MHLGLRVLPLLLPFCLAALGAGCDNGGSTTSSSSSSSSGGACGVEAGSYDGSSLDKNAAAEIAIIASFESLLGTMEGAEVDLSSKPKASELMVFYQAGSPSLQSITTPYFDGVVQTLFQDFEASAGQTWTPSDPPSATGGKYGEFIFNAGGLHVLEGVEKGLMGASLYGRAASLAKGTITAATIDQMLALYGAPPSFPGDSDAATPDTFAAKYAERRSPKDAADPSKPLDAKAPGPYFRIKDAFIRAQQAVLKGSSCDAERDQAVATILDEWERVAFATVIFYLDEAAVDLSGTTEEEVSHGLHGFSEAAGFIHGFRGLPADQRTITDAQIDALLALLGVPHDGPGTAYKLVTDFATEAPKLAQAIDQVASIYGFSAAEVESFKAAY